MVLYIEAKESILRLEQFNRTLKEANQITVMEVYLVEGFQIITIYPSLQS
jgi:hypothetical protein